MFLRELHVKNYMIHQDTKLQLQPLTVFVGPNGGGKSALFDALLNFSMVSRGNLRQAFGPYPFSFRSTIYRGATKIARIGFRVVMARSLEDTETLQYEIDYAQSGAVDDMPQFTIARERVVLQPGDNVLFDRENPDAYLITNIFVQIGDENVHHVRELMDEIFGDQNFCALICFRKTSSANSPVARVNVLGSVADYVLWYAHSREHVKYRQLYVEKEVGGEGAGQYTWIEREREEARPLSANDEAPREELAQGTARLLRPDTLASAGSSEALSAPFEHAGQTFVPPVNSHWKTTPNGLLRLGWAHRLIPIGKRLYYKRYFTDFPVFPLTNVWTDSGPSGFGDARVYVVQTTTRVVERCLLMTTDPGDLVLDPTCGSGTTAYVAEQWGRRWITVDTSRVALALARTRLMAAKYPYYLLADSPEGMQKEAELTGKVPPSYSTEGDIKKGFVYKRVPHVTLKSIANNPEIEKGMSREGIDAAITRHAEIELLCDKPYEDNKRIRVTGPFTVESLSPHRVLSTDDERPKAEAEAKRDSAVGQFEMMIIENLRKAGVQGTTKGQRIRFERLEPHAGTSLQAAGEYQENGKPRRVAVSIGPEHGTVGPQQVKEAAKEAVQGVGYDTLIVCGFAFDPHVSEEVKRYGKLTVLPARMNPDLAMGDELLKKTGAGNLFMVFGEPDVEIKKQKDGKLTVTIAGVDVYDPTTGEIRSSSTDDIACWFIDTDYNGESFFVRHAYFTGADEPYEKLQRALRAEIDEAAWRSLYSTVSRPFDPPATGKIAIKVINHYGDEVLKVFPVA
jgi:adenine-specific DNA-methyltransferase